MPRTPTDEEIIEAIRELAIAEQNRTMAPATVMLGPWTTYVLIASLQLACRSPSLSKSMRSCIEQIARSLQTLFDGNLADHLEAGWDPARDVEQPGEEDR